MDKFLIRNLIKVDECEPNMNQITCSQLGSINKRLESNESLEPRAKRPCVDEDIQNISSHKFSIQNLIKKDDASCVAALNPLSSYKYMSPDYEREEIKDKSESKTLEPFRKHSCCEVTFPNNNIKIHQFKAKTITAENLSLKYGSLFCNGMADYVYQRLEKEVDYFNGDLMRVKIYGKWHDIPRKQVSYGDTGLSYSFSGNCVPAVPWDKCKVVKELKEVVEYVCNRSFNFVLVNRYKDGLDHMGEHRDNEKDLVPSAPIASLSFGQTRDFIFKHKDSRGQRSQRKIDPVKLELEHGSILLMLHPTNLYWYHSLPIRRKIFNTRINLTFRDMIRKA